MYFGEKSHCLAKALGCLFREQPASFLTASSTLRIGFGHWVFHLSYFLISANKLGSQGVRKVFTDSWCCWPCLVLKLITASFLFCFIFLSGEKLPHFLALSLPWIFAWGPPTVAHPLWNVPSWKCPPSETSTKIKTHQTQSVTGAGYINSCAPSSLANAHRNFDMISLYIFYWIVRYSTARRMPLAPNKDRLLPFVIYFPISSLEALLCSLK